MSRFASDPGPPSISQALAAPEESAASRPPTLPDFCNLGVMLRILLGVNLLCFGAALVKARGIDHVPLAFLEIATVVEPALLASLVVLCPLRLVFKSNYVLGVACILMLELVIVTAVWVLFRPLMGFNDGPVLLDLPRYWLLTLGITGLLLYYFALRERAFSPALSHARLQALQARIRPHFLFNSLTAVLSLIRSEPRRAERALEDLADLVRVLMREERRWIKLSEEIEICKRYLSIEELRLGERLQVVWEIDDKVLSARLPPLLLQPLIENAVHHGVEPASAPGRVAIQLSAKASQIEIRIINPWHELDHTAPRKGNHMALSNVRERLKLFFDLEARMSNEVIDLPVLGRSYQVTILIPNRKGMV